MRSRSRPSRRWAKCGTIYVLHFDPPLKQARHYVGFTTTDVWSRLEYHKAGRGSHLMRAVVEAGCEILVARLVFPATRSEERRIKNGCHGVKVCPLCTTHPRAIRTGPDEVTF